MDLHLHWRGDLGNTVFNAYLDLAPETDGLRALPLFLALRAATRSYALAGSAGRRTDPQEGIRLLAFARRHIDAGIEFLEPRHPVLMVLGGRERARTELAPSLASLAHPAPGARILHLDHSGDEIWPLASATLTAGCSVLIEGALTKAADQKEVVELASCVGVSLLRFWAGTLPPNLDARLWQALDSDPATLASLTTVERLQGLVGYRA